MARIKQVFAIPWFVALTIGAILFITYFFGAGLWGQWYGWLFLVLSVGWLVFWVYWTFIKNGEWPVSG